MSEPLTPKERALQRFICSCDKDDCPRMRKVIDAIATAEQRVREEMSEEIALLRRLLAAIFERLDGDREFVCPDGWAELLVLARTALAGQPASEPKK